MNDEHNINDNVNDNDNINDNINDDEFERIARNAAFALRRSAPSDAVRRLEQIRGRRQRTRAVGVSVVGLAVVLGGLVALATRREPTSAGNETTSSVSDTVTRTDGTTSATIDGAASVDGLRAAASAYADAVLHGPLEQVAAFYSASCSNPPTGTEIVGNRHAIASVAGVPLASIVAAGSDVRNFDGTQGEASVAFNLPAALQGNDNWLTYHLENGSWKVVDCNRLPFGGNSTESSSSVPQPGLTAHIELPSTRVVAGTTLQGFLVVSNNSTAPRRVLDRGCAPKWGVALRNAHYVPNIAFTMECLTAPLDFAVGETRLPVTIYTTYFECQQGAAAGSGTTISPACLPSGPPPLPTGDYTAVLVGAIPGLPDPPPVALSLTP